MKYAIILVVLLLGCHTYPEPEKTVVEHYEDRHQEVSGQAIKKLLQSKNDNDTYTFQFTESCRYEHPDRYAGWNKILGKTSLFIHKNSHRLVWRYVSKSGLIEIATYTYKDGNRSWDIIAEGEIGEKITVQFEQKYAFYATAYFGGIYPAPHYMRYYIW